MNTTKQRPNRLRKLADERGQSIGAMLADELAKHGTVKETAEALGVRPMTLYAWLNRNGYRVHLQARLVREQP